MFTGLTQNKPSWTWKVSVGGSAAALSKLQKVTYTHPAGLLVDKDKLDGVIGLTGAAFSGETSKVGLNLLYIDGTTGSVEVTLNFVLPTRSQLKIALTDSYYGVVGGKDNWQWVAKVDGTLNDLVDIQDVVWHLPQTFPNPEFRVTGSAKTGFPVSARGFSKFKLSATVTFQDGTTREIKRDVEFSDPVKKALTLSNKSVLYKVEGETTWYSWTAFLEGPDALLDQVAGVTYLLDPSFRNNVVNVTEGSDFGFPYTVTGWGSFELAAEVTLKNGPVVRLKHRLVLGER